LAGTARPDFESVFPNIVSPRIIGVDKVRSFEPNQPTRTTMHAAVEDILKSTSPDHLREQNYKLYREIFDRGRNAERQRAKSMSGSGPSGVRHWTDKR
jgi:4-diphosphocytidyl-2C-methyl-D-erythritol kinase